MAEQKKTGSKDIPHHPLVAALAPDPDKPPARATKLFGYPGPASGDGAVRLWLSTDLTSYVEVPSEAIIHSQTLKNDQGTRLWVEPSAKLTYSSAQSHEVEAEFLGGSIAEGNLAAAAPAHGIPPRFLPPPPMLPPLSRNEPCLEPMTEVTECATRIEPCTVYCETQHPCVSVNVTCESEVSCRPVRRFDRQADPVMVPYQTPYGRCGTGPEYGCVPWKPSVFAPCISHGIACTVVDC